jgi:HD-like signal output (HDOD) protein
VPQLGSSEARNGPIQVAMIRILFVDDEPNILSGLRRQLHSQRAVWQMRFVGSGELALAALRESAADVVVTDMRMPEMDGAELLRRVQEEWPAIVRLVLSGQCDHGDLLRSVHHAHQYLAKPCDPVVLRRIIERANERRARMRDPAAAVAATRLDHLPSLPLLHHEITVALREDRLPLPEIAGLIEQDVALSAKVMQMVNSAFFGTPRHVSSPSQAAVTLGLETLRSLVLRSGLFSPAPFDDARQRQLASIWVRSQQVAQLSRGFAADFGMDQTSQDRAFLAGLMHETGRVVSLASPDGCPDLPAAEHAALGAWLLTVWGFADEVVTAVAAQAPSDAPDLAARSIQTAMRLAIGVADGETPAPDALRALGATDTYVQRQDSFGLRKP